MTKWEIESYLVPRYWDTSRLILALCSEETRRVEWKDARPWQATPEYPDDVVVRRVIAVILDDRIPVTTEEDW